LPVHARVLTGQSPSLPVILQKWETLISGFIVNIAGIPAENAIFVRLNTDF